jgi:hypothetical protein
MIYEGFNGNNWEKKIVKITRYLHLMFDYIAQKNIQKWLKISTAYMAYSQIQRNDGHFGHIKKTKLPYE